jgi:ankyrin repeat protein
MLKYKSLNHSPHFLSQNGGSLWLTLVKSITLWVLMTSVSCQCGNSDGGLFSFKKENTLSLKVDNPILRGDKQTFCLTIENTSNKSIRLGDYQLKATTKEANVSRINICYQNKQGRTQDLPINRMFGANFIELTDQFDLKLNPGESLTLPSFTINPATDIQELTIDFELIGIFDKTPTATATVTWQNVNYQLHFKELKSWVGDETMRFKLCNNGEEEIDLNNIFIDILTNNQVELKLNGSLANQSKFNVAELFNPVFTILGKGETTPLLALQVSNAYNETSTEVTLRLWNKRNQDLAYQSIQWYSTSVCFHGDNHFKDEQMVLELINQSAKVNIEKIKVYLTSTGDVPFNLNGQEVANDGVYLSDIIEGKKVLDTKVRIQLAPTDVSQALRSEITLELRDEANKVLTSKKISWFNSKLFLKELQQINTSMARIIVLLNQGYTVQEISRKLGPEKGGNFLLYQAVGSGIKEAVYVLLDKGADVNEKNETDSTPLHEAVGRNDKTIVQILLTAKASVSVKDQDGQKPLHIAATRGNLEIVNLLLQKENNKSVADKGNLEKTPLHWAAGLGHNEVAKALIHKGGSYLIEQQDKNEQTALHLAVSQNRPEMVDILLKSGANRNIEDKTGKKPIDYAQNIIIKEKLRSFNKPR